MRQLPATLLERLNFEERSPLRHMIQTPTNPTGVIKDNSMLRMLENSISDGVLYRFREATDPCPHWTDGDRTERLLGSRAGGIR